MTSSPAPQDRRTAAPGQDFPGKTLGIVGLIVALFASLVGLIISAVAYTQSKNAGYKNAPARAGIIVGGAFLVIGIVIAIVAVVAGVVSGGTGY